MHGSASYSCWISGPVGLSKLWIEYAYSYTRSDQKYAIENESIRWCVPKRVQLQMA
jgi:hypothetical protein